MKQTIAVDVDDVLAHSTESVRLRVNQKLGANLVSEHYKVPGEYWGYYERVWKNNGLGEKLNLQELSPKMELDQSHVAPYDGAVQVLRRLSKTYELAVVTARDPSWEQATSKWLDMHFKGLFRNVIFGGRKGEVPNRTKGELCAELGAQYLIDDNVEHCIGAAETGVTPILFGEYGWHLDVPKDMVRCKTWKEIEEYFAAE